MPNLIEDRLSSLLATWIDTNRPEGLPDSIPVHVACRDEIRNRPCVVLNPAESKSVPAMPHTARVKLDCRMKYCKNIQTGYSGHHALRPLRRVPA